MIFFDQPRTIHTGHDQVGEHQVDAAAAEGLERHFATVACEHAVAPRFQHNFADGERLFVIVDTKNRFLGLHWPNRESVVTTFF